MLGGKMGRELALRRALAEVSDDYELILIDCPPSLGLLTVNALVAADRALITAEAQYFALRGVEQAIDVVELARDGLNPELSVLGVLLNLADMRTVHSREALASLNQRFHELVFTRSSAPRSPTPSRRSGPRRSSTTAPTWARTTSRSPTRYSNGCRGCGTCASLAMGTTPAGRLRQRAVSRPTRTLLYELATRSIEVVEDDVARRVGKSMEAAKDDGVRLETAVFLERGLSSLYPRHLESPHRRRFRRDPIGLTSICGSALAQGIGPDRFATRSRQGSGASDLRGRSDGEDAGKARSRNWWRVRHRASDRHRVRPRGRQGRCARPLGRGGDRRGRRGG